MLAACFRGDAAFDLVFGGGGFAFLPLLASVLPSWHRPLWSVSTGFDSGNQVSLALELAPARTRATAHSREAAPALADASARPAIRPAAAAKSPRASTQTGWRLASPRGFAGVALVLISVVVGQIRLRKLSRKARHCRARTGRCCCEETCETLRLRRAVNLLQSADNVMPLTWGWWRPVVLLPAEAGQWPAERRRIVLLHELAHVKRWDCLTQIVARIVCAFYWFNPLVWLAARQMCVERERACDDLVLNGGCKASDYAGHLVEIAGSFRRVPQVAAIAMARSSQIGRPGCRHRGCLPEPAAAFGNGDGHSGCGRRHHRLGLGGNRTDTVGSGADESDSLRKQQIARLEAFSGRRKNSRRYWRQRPAKQFRRSFSDFSTRPPKAIGRR